MPGERVESQKELQDIVETERLSAQTFRAKSYKSAGKQKKKLFEMNITRERREIFSSFERKSSLESLTQNIPKWPSPSHVRNLSFTHDGYIRHTTTEMIIFMTCISDMWHSTGLRGLVLVYFLKAKLAHEKEATGPVRIASRYSTFNGSHFGLPTKSITRMNWLGCSFHVIYDIFAQAKGL